MPQSCSSLQSRTEKTGGLIEERDITEGTMYNANETVGGGLVEGGAKFKRPGASRSTPPNCAPFV